MKQLILPVVFISMFIIFAFCTGKKTPHYEDFTKIDAHMHIRSNNTGIMDVALAENFKYLTICTCASSQDYIDEQLDVAQSLQKKYPAKFAYITAFSMEKFGEPGWLELVLKQLKEDFENGAVGVKVWKDIGMTFKDSLGRYVMIDDPLFDPIFDFIEENDKTILTHIGEPKNCWLPLDSMTVISDRKYFEEHPQYHMYLHPDSPSYERQVELRDIVLANHPNLRMVGAHLGSLEWSVDELAKRLDLYPNFVVDMAERICYFQVQDRQKVIDFIYKYQDRLLYSTDLSFNDTHELKKRKEHFKEIWRKDWVYFTSVEEMTSPSVDSSFKGIGLSEEVLRKIYYVNTLKSYPGIFS